jgi:hypothetical protein
VRWLSCSRSGAARELSNVTALRDPNRRCGGLAPTTLVSERDEVLSGHALTRARGGAAWARLLRVWGRAWAYLQPDEKMSILRAALNPLRGKRGESAAPVVAMECIEDPTFFGLFAALCDEMRAASATRVELVVVRSVNGAVGTGLMQTVARSVPVVRTVAGHYIRALRGIADRVGYRSRTWSRPLSGLRDWWRSGAIWRRARASDRFHELAIDGVQVGDLVIDSYLRFRPRASFNAHDPFTRQLLWQACSDVRGARRYFRRRRPELYLTSFSTYIEHGIAVRAALVEGIPVHSFGSFARFGKRLSKADWFHTPDATAYKATFAALDRRDERLREAEQQLHTRLSGGIDAVTSYMRVSAYRLSSESVPAVAGSCVLFLHDFYDSLHVYPDVVFHDFWSWACFTIDTLRAAGVRFFVKPHPNQMSLSSAALEDLRRKYPDLSMISPAITNAQLAQAGMICGITMYGSVAHELAYLGVPSIACARHPHNAFDFCRTARSIEQYEQYLRTPAVMPLERDEMRRQALAFYYMHNLYGSPQELALRSKYVDYWKVCIGEPTVAELRARLQSLRNCAEFRGFVTQLRSSAGHGD